MTGDGVGGATSSLNGGIPDSSLDLGVGDTVVVGVFSAAAKATGNDTVISPDRTGAIQNSMGSNHNCRIVWRIDLILLANLSRSKRFTMGLDEEQAECRASGEDVLSGSARWI